MFYVYILWSEKSKIFYVGSTNNLKSRIHQHNNGISSSTKPHRPLELVYYCAFKQKTLAGNFEKYLKTGSGKSLMYRRLVDGALKKDVGSPKLNM